MKIEIDIDEFMAGMNDEDFIYIVKNYTTASYLTQYKAAKLIIADTLPNYKASLFEVLKNGDMDEN